MKNINREQELRIILKRANDAYHGADSPIMEDYEYDKLFLELKKLEEKSRKIPKNSPTKTVGSTPSKKFRNISHDTPMLSLSNAFTENDLLAFDKRIVQSLVGDELFEKKEPTIKEFVDNAAGPYILEHKMDGLAVSLKYKNKKLVSAGTRGDGSSGEDVTLNVLTIKDIPQTLDEKCPYEEVEIRGEVYMLKSVLEEINTERLLNDEEPLANVRNAAAGALRQLDPEITRDRRLSFMPYMLVGHDDEEIFQFGSLTSLMLWGFPLPRVYFAQPSEFMAIINEIEKTRYDLPYEIDGVVIKVNKLEYHKYLGATFKDPKWGIAYKFKPPTAKTQLLDIILTVGRTGVLTPNAVLKTVNISGTRVSAATLHNLDYILQKDIRVGDTVEVVRAGDVIPRVERVFTNERKGKEKSWKMPNSCPACGGKIEQEGTAFYCQRASCPPQIIERIRHFASRNAMDIDGFGDAVSELWAPSLKSLADIYIDTGKKLDLIGINGKQKENLLLAIDKSKSNGLGRLLFGLGIRNVGKKTAMDIAKHFNTILRLMSANKKSLTDITGVGEIVANSIKMFFEDINNVKMIHAFRDAGVLLEEKTEIKNNRFEDKIFVLTGTLQNLTREEATLLIEKSGGKVSGSISKNTSYLLAGESAGSKLEKAETLGIQIITEEEFKKMAKID